MLESYLLAIAARAGFRRAPSGLPGIARGRGCRAAAGALVAAMEPSHFCSSVDGRAGSGIAKPEAGPWAWPMLFTGIWALGILAMTARAAGGWMMLWRVRRRSTQFRRRRRSSDRGCRYSAHLRRP